MTLPPFKLSLSGEISPRTGKPKKKPRGRPFHRGSDTRRPGSAGESDTVTATTVEREAFSACAKIAREAKAKSLADFMSEAIAEYNAAITEALKQGDMVTVSNLHASAKKIAEAKFAEQQKELEAKAAYAVAEIEAHAEDARRSAEAKASVAVSGTVPVSLSGINLKDYPLEDMLKLADGIESARKTGKIGVGFSPRRQDMAGKMWMVFRAFGLEPAEAFRLTFGMLASERATDDERPFYEELWLSKMGSKLYPLPTLPTPPAKKGELWHPQAGAVIALIRAGIPVWLAGDAGAGKTFMTTQIAALLGRPIHRLQGSRDRTLEEVVGAWGFSPEKGSYFRYGAVPIAMKEGAILHIDEISALPSEVTFEMHAVAEGSALTLLRNDNEVITKTKGFALVANDNTVGEGERSDMIGTQPVNAAFRDRWAFLRIDALSKTIRKQMVQNTMSRFAAEVI